MKKTVQTPALSIPNRKASLRCDEVLVISPLPVDLDDAEVGVGELGESVALEVDVAVRAAHASVDDLKRDISTRSDGFR